MMASAGLRAIWPIWPNWALCLEDPCTGMARGVPTNKASTLLHSWFSNMESSVPRPCEKSMVSGTGPSFGSNWLEIGPSRSHWQWFSPLQLMLRFCIGTCSSWGWPWSWPSQRRLVSLALPPGSGRGYIVKGSWECYFSQPENYICIGVKIKVSPSS